MAKMPDRETVLNNEKFTLSCTPPIFYDHGHVIDGPIATGTFFKIRGRHYLITAMHTFDDYQVDRILVPKEPKSDELIDLGRYEYIFPNEELDYDVCAFEIIDREKIKELASKWHFLSLSNIGLPSVDGLFLLFGFPTSIRDENKTIKSYHPISAYASRLKEAPDDAPGRLPRDLDLFFEYGGIVDTLEGTEREAPNLKGASGCSIWQAPTSSSSLWLPPRVIGVQTSFFKERYFRGIDWRVVATLLGLTDPLIKTEMDAH